MQTVSADALGALTGSHTPYVKADVWYGGELVAYDLQIISGSVEGTDDGKAIRHRLSLTAADPDGSLIPRSERAALAPYGSRIHLRGGVMLGTGRAESAPLGWFRVETSEASETWRIYDQVDGAVWTASGGSVAVTGLDPAAAIQDSRFLAPESPPSLGSVRTEVIRLCQNLVGVAAWPGVTDRPIPSSVVYTDDRWDAICDLAAVVDAIPYIDPFGQLVFRPNTTGASVWTIPAGEDGILIDASISLDRKGIYNAVVSTGTSPEQVPVQGIRLEFGGNLVWDGPFERVPYFHNSPLITSVAEAHNDAITTMHRLVARRSFPLSVTCVCNYWLQVGDTVTVAAPAGAISGRITEATWPLTPGPMTMTVDVPRDAMWSQWARSAP